MPPDCIYPEFIDTLKREIVKGLPGWEAQKRMAPTGREQSRYSPKSKGTSRESAVLIWLYPEEDKIYTRLILRTDIGVHSGQVAFPGGQVEPDDDSLWVTALREAKEEIGLHPDKITPVGKLTPLYIPPSNFWVHPFIGTGIKSESNTISRDEVQKYFDIEIMQLLEPSIKQKKVISRNADMQILAPYYNLQGYTVWGATAMMLSELEELIRRVLSVS